MKPIMALALATLTAIGVTPLAQAQQTASAHADILAKSESSWNGVKYQHYPSGTPELTVLKLTIPPHTALPWHQHPYPNAGYVLSGQLTIEDKASGKQHTFTQGQAFTESVNDTHRGVSGDTPTELVIVYSGVHGVPTFKAEQDGKPEY